MKSSSVSLPPLPEQRIMVQGGGNVGNALTGAARLGLNPRIISKVANDAPGRGILAELEADGVDTSYIVVSETGNSPFTYVIVDTQMKTRTSIHSPGTLPMIPEDLPASTLLSALTGARIVYFDGRHPQIALIVAKEAWTEAPSIASALLAMALRLPRLKFVIVTLGEAGCIMLEKHMQETTEGEILDVNIVLESLQKKAKGLNSNLPISVSSEVGSLEAAGIGKIYGRLLVGTTEAIPPSELVDTTGAGDGFIGSVLYALIASMPPERMLPFAAKVAAAGCRALGARTGLPYRSDSQLVTYL